MAPRINHQECFRGIFHQEFFTRNFFTRNFSPGIFSPGIFHQEFFHQEFFTRNFSPGIFSPGIFSPGIFHLEFFHQEFCELSHNVYFDNPHQIPDLYWRVPLPACFGKDFQQMFFGGIILVRIFGKFFKRFGNNFRQKFLGEIAQKIQFCGIFAGKAIRDSLKRISTNKAN